VFFNVRYDLFIDIICPQKEKGIMKLKRSLEEAVCIILVLASEAEGTPVKSALLSEQLGVSDSYLKKIVRKLVVSGIVLSSVSKGGGFRLARSLDQINMLDVYHAIEGEESCVQLKQLAKRVFSSEQESNTVEENLTHLLRESEQQFLNRLKGYPLSRLFIQKH
jgi:Rrf2 family iron-sulfur cluster assembly transcriptional regulator